MGEKGCEEIENPRKYPIWKWEGTEKFEYTTDETKRGNAYKKRKEKGQNKKKMKKKERKYTVQHPDSQRPRGKEA